MEGIVFSRASGEIAGAGWFGTVVGELFANMSVAAQGADRSHFSRNRAPCANIGAGINHNSNPKKIMKRIITAIAALAFSFVLTQPTFAAKGEKKKGDPEAAWKKLAGDKESVTKEEFTAHAKDKAKAEALFAKKDKNADGKLTKEEFLAHGKKKK